MPRMVSLESVSYLLAVDLYGNPLRLERCQRSYHHGDAGRRPDRASPSFRLTRAVDEPSQGGSSLSLVVSVQNALEARDRAFLHQFEPHISVMSMKMLEGLFIDDLSLDEIARREKHKRQALSQRLARLCRRFPNLAERWQRRKASRKEIGECE
jgi:predicted DNA-binding protein YlxM (UPF0122 family)